MAKATLEKIHSQANDFTWININHAGQEEVDYLAKHFKFHRLDLEDCLSETQRSKIDDYDDYLFLVLHIPKKGARRNHIRNSEVDIFIGMNFIVTLHEDDRSIKGVFDECKGDKSVRDEYMKNGPGYFLYKIIDQFFEHCFPLFDDMTKQLNELERDVFDSEQSRDRLREILLLKKDIINFRRIIMPQRAILAQLEHKNKKFLPENLDVYFDDIVDKVEKIWNSLENLQELVASLQETNESIISHNTNNIIKVLTIFSVVMLPMTFITGFYGMNLENLPFAETSFSVIAVTGILVFVAVAMIAYFKYKKWL